MNKLPFKKKIMLSSIGLLVLVLGILAYIQDKEGYNIPNTINNSEVSTSSSSSDIIKQPALTITNAYLDNQKNGYYNVVIGLKNNSSDTINYVKVNMFFKDINGNIIKSDWTNDDSPILGGAIQKLEKFCKLDDKIVHVDCEIAEYH
ncbi:hypothetical protein [Inconstantimicrobium mannanitabidum]|uniref:Uncharacterized protein n=1 Tax=Inconstantimicrobium mannanitabidum TaxID=1604901 RepID=A0ACB5R9E2_9CLOT|nr:hypothetical protein [Clostridium sp. TW13]GKX65808.1 hypothetical protein rsdtw13_10660 [Clostridium sp. TW13]